MVTQTGYDLTQIAQIFDSHPDSVMLFSPVFTDERESDLPYDFEIEYCNVAAGVMLGMPLTDIEGKKVIGSDLFQVAGKQNLFNNCLGVLKLRKPAEISLTTDGGENKLYLSGLHNGVLSISRYTTPIQKTVSRVEYHDELLNSLLDANIDGMFIAEAVPIDEHAPDFKITHANNIFLGCFNLSPVEVLGKFYSEIFPSAWHEKLRSLHSQVIKTGEPATSEDVLKQNETHRSFRLIASRWGQNGIVQIFRDETALKHKNEKLESLEASLKQSIASLTEFTYLASHDLNEPLRKITTFSKLLSNRLSQSVDKEANTYLNKIESSAERMQIMLSNLLVYSRMNRQATKPEPVSFEAVLEEVIAANQQVITQKNVKILISDFPLLKFDRLQLKQLLHHLLSNALKFQSINSVPEISVQYKGIQNKKHGLTFKTFDVIEFLDNGIGFDPLEAEKIFQVFYRLHTRHEYEGTGIGLAIAKRVMENHNGEIVAESESKKGSCFRLFFLKE